MHCIVINTGSYAVFLANVVKEYGKSVVDSHFCERIKKYSTYFGSSHINLISVVVQLLMFIFQKHYCSFVFFKMEKMMAHILKYLERDMQH